MSGNFLKILLPIFLYAVFSQATAKGIKRYQPAQFPGKTGIEANMHVGRVFRHTTNFRPTINGPSYAIEVSAFKQTDGSKNWQKKLHYPEIGGGFYAVIHHNRDTIGNGFGTYMFWKYPLVRSKVVDFYLKMGAGLGVLTKKYDAIKNPVDNPIGSYVNVFVLIRFGLDWKISRQFKLVTAFTYSHFSDGAVQLPNLGINTPTGTIGLVYYPQNKPIAVNRDSFSRKPVLKNELYAKAGIGMLDVTKFIKEKPWLMQTTSIGYSRYINICNKLSAGLTLEFNFGEPHIYVNTLETEKKKLKKAATELSINIADEILIGRFAMHFELGAYLYHTYRLPLPIYFKLGGAYYLPDMGKKKRSSMFVNGNVKAHGATAQLVEGNIGGVWKFNKK